MFANSFAQLTVSVKSSRFVTANFSHGRLRVRDTCEWSDDAIQIQIPGCSVSQTMTTTTTTVSRARRQLQKACSDNLTHMHRPHAQTRRHTYRHSHWHSLSMEAGKASHTSAACVFFLFCFAIRRGSSESCIGISVAVHCLQFALPRSLAIRTVCLYVC